MRNMIKSLFFPSFLRRFDEKLLVERPWLWSTRLHRVAWPALLLALLSMGLGMFTPVMRPYSIEQFISLGTLGIVLAQIGLVIYWLYGQDAYSVEREHGIARDKTGWREFGTYLGALSMIGLSLFLFLATVRHRAQTINNGQFARDFFLITLVSDMEHRDRYLRTMFRDHLEETMPYHPDWNGEHHLQLTETQYQENRVFEQELRRIMALRSTYETNLDRASVYFTADSREELLKQYVFDYDHRYEHDTTIETEIVWSYEATDYWGSDHFLNENLDIADLIPLQTEWANGDYSTLFDVLSRYSGTPIETIEAQWEEWAMSDAMYQNKMDRSDNRYYRGDMLSRYEHQASSSARNILDFAFNPTSNLAIVFWSIVGAIAVHLSLLRFTFKHSGAKGFIFLMLSVVGVAFAAGLYILIGTLLDSQISYRADFIEKYMTVGLSIPLVITLALFAYTRTIPRRSSFTWKMSMALYILPLLIAVAPYILFGIEEIVTEMVNNHGWFSTHFIESDPYFYSNNIRQETWSVSPLGKYMLYSAQFVYVPLLGWLKQKHTQLMSLPRS